MSYQNRIYGQDIKYGPEYKLYRLICHNCSAVIDCSSNELRESTYCITNGWGSREGCRTFVKCNSCNQTIWFYGPISLNVENKHIFIRK